MPKSKKLIRPSKHGSQTRTFLKKEYVRQRELFFAQHPWSRMLLGMFIVSFAIFLGVMIYNQTYAKLFVGLTLDEYGIEYPYSEVPVLLKK